MISARHAKGNVRMDQVDIELLCQVHEDIDHLRNASRPPFANDTPRRLANELRRLLIEGQLQAAWKMLGNPRSPVIRANKMHDFVKRNNSFAISLGATLNGEMKIGGFMSGEGEFSKEEIESYAKESFELLNFPFLMNEFLDSTSIWCENVSISRRNIILYVAVKMGGVHYDTKRKDNKRDKIFSVIDKILDKGWYFGGYTEIIDNDKVEKIDKNLRPDNATGPLAAEIVSYCQSICSSPDVMELQKQIKDCVDFSARRSI